MDLNKLVLDMETGLLIRMATDRDLKDYQVFVHPEEGRIDITVFVQAEPVKHITTSIQIARNLSER